MADGATRDTAPRPALVTAPPVPINARRIVAIGTGLWLVAFVVLLIAHDWVGAHHHRLWLWTCLAGTVLGLLGSALMARHARQGRTV